MSSSGWLRVAAGFRLVAAEAAKQASKEAGSVATRTARHGVDLASNLRSLSAVMTPPTSTTTTSSSMDQAAYPQQQQQPNGSSRSAYEQPPINGFAPPQESHKEPNTKVSAATASTNATETEQTGPKDQDGPSLTMEPDNLVATENQIRTGSDRKYVDSKKEEEEESMYDRLKEGRAVPSTRAGRAFGFASLGFGLAMGAFQEVGSRLTGSSTKSGRNFLVTDGNADRLAQSLCRMRGAALKMGQMLSIQDESLLPPELTRALNQVRQGADAMPEYQLRRQLVAQFGENWEQKFESFDMLPFAAASVGQCHRAKIRNGGEVKDVVVKVQYPGVGRSIESDLRNLSMLVTWTGLAPKGLFIENVIRVGQEELKVECDYVNELRNQKRMKELVESDPVLRENRFVVPEAFEDLSTEQIITTEFSRGGTIDKVANLDQEERNRIARTIMHLTIKELFVWRFMQTDPNWGNFLYDVGTQTTTLIDFGATSEYSKEFVDGYLRIVWASANMDEERLMEQSYKMGFLTGDENDAMLRAHKLSGYTVGEPFRMNEPFDFQGSKLSTRMGEHTSVFLKNRLT